MGFCGDLGLRLPSPSEAVALGKGFDVPNVGSFDQFWTDNFFKSGETALAIVGDEACQERLKPPSLAVRAARLATIVSSARLVTRTTGGRSDFFKALAERLTGR